MRIWLIAKSNIKKKKGNAFTLFILIMLSVVLLYTSVNVLVSVGSFLSDKNEMQNGAHVVIMSTPNYKDEVLDLIENTDHYAACDVTEKIYVASTSKLKNTSNTNIKEEAMTVQFGNLNDNSEISNWTIVDKGDHIEKNSIVLPMFLKVARGYKTGDEMTITVGNTTKTFKVYGFMEDTMYSIPSNITIYSCKIADEMFQEIKSEAGIKLCNYYCIRTDSESASVDYESDITKKINEQMTQLDFGTYNIMNIVNFMGGTAVFIDILMVVLAAFSVVMTLISLLVIRFNITSHIEENLPNIGILQAAGYTSRQLKMAELLEYVSIAVVSIAMGFIVSTITSSFIGDVVSKSIGMIWKPSVNIKVGIIVVIFIMVFVIGIVLFSSRKLKKITTLDALRGGIASHNFKRNVVTLSESKLDVNTSLGVKSLFHNFKQNIAVMLIIILLSFACILVFMTNYNFTGDSTALLTLVGIEKCDIEMADSKKSDDELENIASKLEKRGEIDRTVLYGSQGVTFLKNGKEMSVWATIYSDFSKLAIDIIYDGRNPQNDNEVVITSSVAKQLNVKIGDSVTIKAGENSASYIICGFSQYISNMGIGCRMTKAAVHRINPDFGYNGINVYVDQSVITTENEVETLKDEYKNDDDMRISNVEESFDTIIGTFKDALSIMCITFVIITGVVVMLIILLIIRMKLIREKQSMGVFKAIGYTTRQLIWQTVMSIVPVISIGGIIGAVAGSLSINEIFVLMLKFCEIQNAHMKISVSIVVISCISIIIFSFVMAVLVSGRIRKIEPYKMIIEE